MISDHKRRDLAAEHKERARALLADNPGKLVCYCTRFATRPLVSKHVDRAEAAVDFGRNNLPGPDLWGQSREEQYDIVVVGDDGETTETICTYETVVWRHGEL